VQYLRNRSRLLRPPHASNGSPIGTDPSVPYGIEWANVAAGSYSLTSRATDNLGAQTTSSAVPITVNAPPTVSLTSPANGATFTAPASITLTANAADTDGTVTSVEFYQGTTLITTLSAAPYTFTWTNVPQGAYVLTAKATDDRGATTTSAPVNITVGAALGQLYFIHADHLNTPRLVADATGTTVWRWDQQEPFGNNPADQNPSGLGAFDLPLRLPGQRYDAETGLHYNYFRDYDPSIGRYGESDPIGLRGGLNTYAYGLSSPLIHVDPEGLDVTLYCRAVQGTDGRYTHCYVHVSCPVQGIDEVLSLFGKLPYGIGGLPAVGFKSSASSLDGGPMRDDPSAPGQWSAPITPQVPNCDCRCEKEVISRFYQRRPRSGTVAPLRTATRSRST